MADSQGGRNTPSLSLTDVAEASIFGFGKVAEGWFSAARLIDANDFGRAIFGPSGAQNELLRLEYTVAVETTWT